MLVIVNVMPAASNRLNREPDVRLARRGRCQCADEVAGCRLPAAGLQVCVKVILKLRWELLRRWWRQCARSAVGRRLSAAGLSVQRVNGKHCTDSHRCGVLHRVSRHSWLGIALGMATPLQSSLPCHCHTHSWADAGSAHGISGKQFPLAGTLLAWCTSTKERTPCCVRSHVSIEI